MSNDVPVVAPAWRVDLYSWPLLPVFNHISFIVGAGALELGRDVHYTYIPLTILFLLSCGMIIDRGLLTYQIALIKTKL
jgi:hypothetical protein